MPENAAKNADSFDSGQLLPCATAMPSFDGLATRKALATSFGRMP